MLLPECVLVCVRTMMGDGLVEEYQHNYWCLHVGIILAWSKHYSQRIMYAQVKGVAKVIVTVVATQELEAGDMLLRFEAEAARDEPDGGENFFLGT